MKKDYLIKNYVCYEVSDFLVVQTEDAILKIYNSDMKVFFKVHERTALVSSDELEDFFGKSLFQDALNFLEENGLIFIKEKMNFNVQRFFAISNDSVILQELDRYCKNDIFSVAEIETATFDRFLESEVCENDFILCILNPYSTELAKKVYNKLKNVDAYLLMGYPYHFEFFFDNIYNFYWNNPNHFDHIGFINERSFSEENNMTYKELLDLVFSTTTFEETSIPFTYKTMNIIMYNIIFLLDKYLFLNNVNLRADELMNVFRIDYKNGKRQKDSAIFWELRSLYDE